MLGTSFIFILLRSVVLTQRRRHLTKTSNCYDYWYVNVLTYTFKHVLRVSVRFVIKKKMYPLYCEGFHCIIGTFQSFTGSTKTLANLFSLFGGKDVTNWTVIFSLAPPAQSYNASVGRLVCFSLVNFAAGTLEKLKYPCFCVSLYRPVHANVARFLWCLNCIRPVGDVRRTFPTQGLLVLLLCPYICAPSDGTSFSEFSRGSRS